MAKLTVKTAIGLVSGLLAFSSPAADSEPQPGTEPPRYLRYGFTLRNTTARLVPAAELWVCAPLRETAFQRVLESKTTPEAGGITDALGNQLRYFVFSNVPPYAVKLVAVEATLAMSAEPLPLKAEPDRWLNAGPLFEFEDEAFGRLAPSFPAGPPEQVARAVFDWVRGHVRGAGYDGTDRGALYALTQGRGDCTEYAALFVALCRRAGIPARALGGYVLDRNAVLDPAAYHNWAEFLMEGRWQLADPDRGAFMTGAEQYVATRILGESDSPLGSYARFRCLGEGITAEMNR